MKLRDPESSALLDAYRAHTQPSAEAKRRMQSVLLGTKADERRAWPWMLAGAVTAAAVALWLVLAGVGGPLGMTARSNPSTASDQAQPNAPVRAATGGPRARASNPAPPPLQPASPMPAALPPEPATPGPLPARARSDKRTADPEDTGTIDAVANEWRRIDAAERALAQGKPSLALVELDLHAQEFPRADLRQERRALRVLALCALGRATEGKGQQRAFLREFPRSTYRARVERACAP